LIAQDKAVKCAMALAAFIAGAGFAEETIVSQPDLGITEARWVALDTDLVEFLTLSPGECLRQPDDDEGRYLFEIGRASFKSPMLFGGPAARSGLSCNSCHRDGRDNPAFFLGGLSGDPGTADVTSSLFSKTREDGVFNPALIPTLVDAGKKASFGVRKPQPTLHAFIAGAVRDEFQGAPPPEIIAGLSAYVAHLSSNHCPEGPVPRTVDQAIFDVARTLAVAQSALDRGDGAAADFLIMTAQRLTGDIHERYARPRLAREQALLIEFSRALGVIRLKTAAPEAAQQGLYEIVAQWSDVAKRLRKRRKKSLYNRKILQRVLDENRMDGDRPVD